MLTLVFAHVDEPERSGRRLKCSFQHGFRCAHECHDRAVGGFARIHIEELDATNRANAFGYRIDDGFVAAFREIGYTFDQSHGTMMRSGGWCRNAKNWTESAVMSITCLCVSLPRPMMAASPQF